MFRKTFCKATLSVTLHVMLTLLPAFCEEGFAFTFVICGGIESIITFTSTANTPFPPFELIEILHVCKPADKLVVFIVTVIVLCSPLDKPTDGLIAIQLQLEAKE